MIWSQSRLDASPKITVAGHSLYLYFSDDGHRIGMDLNALALA
ncbi:MAG: hypothetical protein OXF07_05480 [Rhodobacter sp.]|nr:hypothetical protein [Rhodobacter sp.]MCY4169320.1 hypothetical protein [Rhodobacter sp.]MCY4240183.1 hypothetical protein [Rhodobacter sp.]